MWYWAYTRSPSYALTQARVAITQHDIVKFDKYVDSDTLVGSAVDALMDSALQEMNTRHASHDQWESLGQNLATGLVSLMKPQLVASLKAQLRDAVEQGDIDQFGPTENRVFADL